MKKYFAILLSLLLMAGCARENVRKALVVGGVASSALLRELLQARLEKAGSAICATFGKPEYSADNAAGIAFLGMRSHAYAMESRTSNRRSLT